MSPSSTVATPRWMQHGRAGVIVLALSAIGACASAPPPVPPAPQPVQEPVPEPTVEAPTPPPVTVSAPAPAPRAVGGARSFRDLVRDAVARRGFFDTYERGEALYLAIPADRIGEEFLLTFKIAQGIGARGVFGGTMLNIFDGAIVAFERHGDRVFLVQRPTRFTAPEHTPVARAVELSFGSSVLETARIEAVRDDGALAINIADWVLSDLSNVGQRVRGAASDTPSPNPPPVGLDRSRSHLESVKSFERNLNIRAKLTFRPAQPGSLSAVPDMRFIPVSVFYSFAKLPDVPMEPRVGDDRVGYFLTVRKDFSLDDSEFFLRYVNRWRLEPSGEIVDGLMVPIEPIVYYIDRTVPYEYRQYMIEGVEAWNPAFEAAGWKDAIQARILPDSADAEDIRYATLRWSTSDEPGYSAIGPSIVDPRTGEILDADMLFEASMMRGFRRDWRTAISPAAAIEAQFGLSDEELQAIASGVKAPGWSAELSAQGSLLRATLAARGEISPTEAVPMEYVGQALRWVTMHEVGHTLGLRHNFRSSIDTPMEMLNDREWAEERGVFGSVMDYPALNLPHQGGSVGYFYNPGLGSYDRWAISYGYVHDHEAAREIARQAAQPGHAYGTDEDASGQGALDPTVNPYDLGDDPLRWGKERAAHIASLWPRLPEHVLADDSRYADLTDAFNTLLVQYARALAVAPKYIGGQFVNRDRVGDPDGRDPFVPVPRSTQREALAFLNEYAFGERAFDVPQSTLAQLGPNRWSHWGESNTFAGRIDYPYHERVLSVQISLLNQITSPFLFARIRDAELKFGRSAVLPIPELMEELTRSIWSESWAGSRNTGATRRDLQRAYIDRMTEIVVTPPARMPADGRALARYRLADLERRLVRALNRGGQDAYTRAHLAESRERIAKALQAGLEVERR
jgi:hypothetical protein